MKALHPQFIKNSKGEKLFVILPAAEFDAIIEELEDQEDIRLFDEAQKEDDGERVLLSDYLKKRGLENG
jgi:hypothetical protein